MIKTKTLFYILAALITAGLLISISGILFPFVLAGVLAYILDPLADKLEKKGLSRRLISSILVIFLLALMLLIVSLLSLLLADGFKEVNYIFNNYNTILEQKILPFIAPILPQNFEPSMLLTFIESQSDVISKNVTKGLQALVSSSLQIFNLISIFLITPLAFFYLLKDWDKILDILNALLPRNEKNYISVVLKKIDNKLAAFIRGQLLVCLFLGTFYGIGLSLIGLKFGFIIGFITGILSFIPFVGMLIGVVGALSMALLQFPITDYQVFILILIVFAIGQVLESSVVSPKLVGDALGIHPLWIIFVVLAGGELGGFVGVLIALPVAAIISVIATELLNYYKNSSIYLKELNKQSLKSENKE